jgi:hypothetical protein
MRIFTDTEFTGLHKNTTLISIGLVTQDNQKFYAEFNDYDRSQCDVWINENVISKLKWNDSEVFFEADTETKITYVKNDKEHISLLLHKWLSQYKNIEFWGDAIAYDWVLFMDLLGMGSPMRNMPKNFTSYQAYDIFTALKMKGLNSRENRHVLLGIENKINQHNSLYDAEIIKMLHGKYVEVPEVSR